LLISLLLKLKDFLLPCLVRYLQQTVFTYIGSIAMKLS